MAKLLQGALARFVLSSPQFICSGSHLFLLVSRCNLKDSYKAMKLEPSISLLVSV